MSRVSIIIPSRQELFLPQTVADLLNKAVGDIEVIAVLDGYRADLPEDKRLKVVHFNRPHGMRAAVNAGAEHATGEYYLKCDAHCMFAPGYDEALKVDIEDNWVVIPRRYSLRAETWSLQEKEPIDYEHIFYPYAHPDDLGLHARPWMQRARERKDILLDEDMGFQGSCWFMSAVHFHEHLTGMHEEEGYGWFMGEPQEIGFKTWLGPWEGKIMRNKKTWYAHLHKGKQWGRMYNMSNASRKPGNAHSFNFWWNNLWEERTHDIDWLIDRFMPIPGWPENWKEIHDRE
jgi:glycosyltransferase involved in cell wall biosynthesis